MSGEESDGGDDYSHAEDVCIFGDAVIRLYMAPPALFHQLCLQENLYKEENQGGAARRTDCTGLRVHAGAYVAMRFFNRFFGDTAKSLLDILTIKSACIRIVECGSGTGIVGLYGALRGLCPHMQTNVLLTDGNLDALRLIDKNINHFKNTDQQYRRRNDGTNSSLESHHLIWDDDEHLNQALVDGPFNLVIGCELIYYSTSSATLFTAMLRLLDEERGLIVHTHIFRRHDADTEIFDFFGERRFVTLEVPRAYFCSDHELIDRPEFLKVRTLVTCSDGVAGRLRDAYPSWREFIVEEEEEEDFINCIDL